MQVAIVHYWLFHMRGGEKVIEALCEMFPEADIFAHIYDPTAISPKITRHKVTTTFIQRLPFARRMYQKYLPLMPMALEQLDLTGYDLVISSESGPSKGVITRPDALHVCYCHSPMRYLWDHYHLYRARASLPSRIAMLLFFGRLRQWDVTSSARVDRFIANSSHVSGRIRKYYRRESDVVHPPVDIDNFDIDPKARPGEYYLWAGELVHYKRPDLAIEAFNKLGLALVVVGDGEERKSLQKVSGANISFLGKVSFEELCKLYRGCRALVFPGEEDFGIIPVEVMASGRPVIAYGHGGILDSVKEFETGIFFREQSVEGLMRAVERFQEIECSFDPASIRRHAARFSRAAFKRGIAAALMGLGVDISARAESSESGCAVRGR